MDIIYSIISYMTIYSYNSVTMESSLHCLLVVPISDLPPELWEKDLMGQSPASPVVERWLQN